MRQLLSIFREAQAQAQARVQAETAAAVERLQAVLPVADVCQDVECSICLSAGTTDCWRELPCSHSYHENCLLEWVRHAAHRVCPLCRFDLDNLTMVTSDRRTTLPRGTLADLLGDVNPAVDEQEEMDAQLALEPHDADISDITVSMASVSSGHAELFTTEGSTHDDGTAVHTFEERLAQIGRLQRLNRHIQEVQRHMEEVQQSLQTMSIEQRQMVTVTVNQAYQQLFSSSGVARLSEDPDEM